MASCGVFFSGPYSAQEPAVGDASTSHEEETANLRPKMFPQAADKL